MASGKELPGPMKCRTPSSLPHSLHGHFLKDSCCQVCGWTVDQQPGDVTCEAQHHRHWPSSALSVLVGEPGPLLLSGRTGTASHPIPTRYGHTWYGQGLTVGTGQAPGYSFTHHQLPLFYVCVPLALPEQSEAQYPCIP
ncbi:hypothetical protein MG293_014583 [Ovis ammon polii]|uniref:Uncharacterized protein n=1 Tax=Ovis ammon polii TaxID=230172 RepID=A0AAD4TZ52_OVIAM|nr:hypothetical protein MG293_014583 [Ovis ammon polii]